MNGYQITTYAAKPGEPDVRESYFKASGTVPVVREEDWNHDGTFVKTPEPPRAASDDICTIPKEF